MVSAIHLSGQHRQSTPCQPGEQGERYIKAKSLHFSMPASGEAEMAALPAVTGHKASALRNCVTHLRGSNTGG